MAFADFSVPSTVRRLQVLDADGVFYQTIADGGVYAGSLITRAGTLCMSSAAGLPAASVALEDLWPSTSGTIQCAMYAILEPGNDKSTATPPVYTRRTHGGTAGQQLYAASSGLCSTLSSYTNMQLVGTVLDTYQIALAPTVLSTSIADNLGDTLVVAGDVRINDAVTIASGLKVNTNKFTCSSAGVVAIAGTLSVTGAPTVTGAATLNGGLIVGTNVDMVLTGTDVAASASAAPVGYLTISGDAAAVAVTLSTGPAEGEFLFITDLANSANDKTHSVTVDVGGAFCYGSKTTYIKWTSSAERGYLALVGLSSLYWAVLGVHSTSALTTV